jgi:hypothetical protein
VYDQNHAQISTQTTAFNASLSNTFVIFPKTSDALPGSQVNTVEGAARISPQRFASLRIEFAAQPLRDWNPNLGTDPRAAGLFFDPSLVVLPTGEQIHSNDVRLLSIPSTTWVWPEEGVRIDRAYPLVKFTAGNPPTFSFATDWWQTSSNCVYNGVSCGTP